MGKRADNNDGSCREILKGKLAGKWRVQFIYVDNLGRKERLSRVFGTKTDAKTFLQDLRRGKHIGERDQSKEPTLSEWFDWLVENDWPESLASSTIEYRKRRFFKYTKKAFGHVPLSKIDPIRVRAFYRELRSRGVSDSLVTEIKSDLVRVFNQAIAPYQQVPMTVANPFRLSVPTPQARNAVALSPAEVRTALGQAGLTNSQRAMLGLFLLGGLRLGELMAITRAQVRLDEDLIAIDRAVRIEFGGKQNVGLPKGDKTRFAVMCRTLKDILVPFVATMADDELLWPCATENKPRMKKLVYATWRTVVNAAKLPEDMSPHDCRLTHVNIIEKLMPDVSPTTLKEHIGHSATGVTEANYTRPITAAQCILRDELDRVFGQGK